MVPRFQLLLMLVLAALAPQSATFGQAMPAAVEWIPGDAVVALELAQPKALLDLLAGQEAGAFIKSLPAYREQTSNPKFQQFLAVLGYMEAELGTDWRSALAKLTGGGITLAVCPQETVVLIIDAEDAQLLERLHEMLLKMARSEAEKNGRPGRIASTQYGDVTAWTFGAKEAHAIIGKRLVIANRPEGLKAVLDLRAEKWGDNLASRQTYRAARRRLSQSGEKAFATVFADIGLLNQAPNIARVLKQQGANPLAAFSLAGIVEAIRDSSSLALGLYVEGRTLACRALVDGRTTSGTNAASFALPKEPDEGVLPDLSVPRRIAALSLYRDLHEFYAAKDELFPERTSGLIFFENMMGIFFSGRDLTNEVLAQTRPQIRLVVAEQQFDPATGIPSVKLPAFALILRLRDAEQFDEVVEEAWQKAIGLVNFTRGQQAMPGLIIDRPVYNDTKLTVAYFSTAEIEDKTELPQRFNVRPSLAMPGDYVVFSSTDSLARDLVDALSHEIERTVEPLAHTHSLLEIDGTRLASILEANRQTLVRGEMVKKGSTQAEAAAGIDLLITMSKLVEGLKLSVGIQEGATEAKLEMKLNFQSDDGGAGAALRAAGS